MFEFVILSTKQANKSVCSCQQSKDNKKTMIRNNRLLKMSREPLLSIELKYVIQKI